MRNVIRPPRLVLLALLINLVPIAFAGGLELNVGTYPLNGFSVSANVVLPLFESNDVQHAARADIAYAFAGLPAASTTYMLRGKHAGSTVLRYLGVGFGLSFSEAPVASPLLSGHALAGMQFPLAGRLSAFSEVVVAGNSLGSRLSLGAGVSLVLGGN